MHLRRDTDHVEHGEDDLSEKIVILSLSCDHKSYRYVFLLFIKFIVHVIVRFAANVICDVLLCGYPELLSLSEEIIEVVLVLLH